MHICLSTKHEKELCKIPQDVPSSTTFLISPMTCTRHTTCLERRDDKCQRAEHRQASPENGLFLAHHRSRAPLYAGRNVAVGFHEPHKEDPRIVPRASRIARRRRRSRGTEGSYPLRIRERPHPRADDGHLAAPLMGRYAHRPVLSICPPIYPPVYPPIYPLIISHVQSVTRIIIKKRESVLRRNSVRMDWCHSSFNTLRTAQSP